MAGGTTDSSANWFSGELEDRPSHGHARTGSAPQQNKDQRKNNFPPDHHPFVRSRLKELRNCEELTRDSLYIRTRTSAIPVVQIHVTYIKVFILL